MALVITIRKRQRMAEELTLKERASAFLKRVADVSPIKVEVVTVLPADTAETCATGGLIMAKVTDLPTCDTGEGCYMESMSPESIVEVPVECSGCRGIKSRVDLNELTTCGACKELVPVHRPHFCSASGELQTASTPE